MRVKNISGLIMAVCLFPVSLLAAQNLAMQENELQGLSLQDAEKLAIERDTLIKSFYEKAQAFVEQSKAVNTWPDPRIKLGAQAVPIDSFDLEQEPMTQLILGYQQMLPRGDSLEYAAESMSAMSRMQLAKAEKRKRNVLLQVRRAWLDVVLQSESIRIIQANRQLFIKMLDISQSYYAAGRQHQQDVVQAELEISLVDDRLEQVISKLIVSKANLAKWVGEENVLGGIEFNKTDLAMKPLTNTLALQKALEQNPELVVANENIISQIKKLDMADEQYSPQWGFDINYGSRSGNNPDGSERDDFLTAMVTLDLPVFTENKQDRTVAAEKQKLQASRYEQQDVKRMLTRRLQGINGRLKKLSDRYQLYKKKVIPQARQNAEVAMSGYQSGVVSFFTLTRAQVTELNTRLSDLRIKVDFNKAYAELQYLTGERS